jgi:hypothetical protein
MSNQDFNLILEELGEDELRVFSVLVDPITYNESTGARIGQGSPYPASIAQVLGALLPGWSDVKIENAIKKLESRGLVTGLSSNYGVLRNDRGIRVLEDWLSEKGKGCARLLPRSEP